MILSANDISNAIKYDEIIIEPYSSERLQPASVDLTLSNEFAIFDRAQSRPVDPKIDSTNRFKFVETNSYFEMKPDTFVVASTRERIGLSDGYSARVEGKSSLGRLGLAIHITAGFIDPGFDGHITLEIVNHLPVSILLYPGMPICQISFHMLLNRARKVYGEDISSKYQGQTGPTLSKIHLNFEGEN